MAEKPYNDPAFQEQLIGRARDLGASEEDINNALRRSPRRTEANAVPTGEVQEAQPAPPGMKEEVEEQFPIEEEEERAGTEFSPILSTDYNTLREEREREMERAEQEELDSGELWDLARENVTLGAAMERTLELRGSERDEEFIAGQDERLKKEASKHSDKELEFLAEAVNQEDYQARKDRIAEDRKRHQMLANEGLRGMAYEMAAGMTDEALLPLYLLTGGLGAVGRTSLLSRTLSTGAVGAAEGAAIEATIKGSDTQRDWTDVMIAGASGGLISSAIPLGAAGYKRLRHGKEPRVDPDRTEEYADAFDEARQADEDLQKLARMHEIDRTVADIDNTISIESLRNIDGRQQLIDELLPTAKQRMSKGQRKQLLSERSRLENELQQLSESQQSVPAIDPGGTARIRRRRAQERQERMRDIEAKMIPVRDRLDQINQRIKEDEPLREAWADISRLSQGVIPDRLKGKLADSMEAQMSPVNREELRRAGDMAQRARELREERARLEAEQSRRAAQEADTVDPTPSGRIPDDSVGAMRVEGASYSDDVFSTPEEGVVEEMTAQAAQIGAATPRADRLRRLAGMGVKPLKSLYSQLDRSPSDMIRGLSKMLISDPQVAGKGHIPAAIYQDTFLNRAINAEGGREFEAKKAWAARNGISSYRMHLNVGDEMKEFDNQVILAIRRGEHEDPDIMEAAKARQALFKEALAMRKRHGVKGFEDVEDHDAYWSLLFDGNKIINTIGNHRKDDVIETMTGAYMNGRYRLKESTARIVARAQYERAVGSTVRSRREGVKQVLSEGNLVVIRQDLEDLGVPTEQIDGFLEGMQDVRATEQVSNRAKMSLGASISYEYKGIRMVDLIQTDQNVPMRYAREASADAGLATQGFSSRGEAEATITNAEETSRNIILNEKQEAKARGASKKELEDFDKQAKEVGDDAQKLKESISLMYGESLDIDAEGKIAFGVKTARQARKYASVIRLGWNGYASISENSNAIVNQGFGTVMRNTKFKDFAAFGKIDESEDLKGMYKLIGAYGQRGAWIKNNNYLLETMDEPGQGKFEQIFNNAYGYVSNKTQLLSGYRAIQHGSEDLVLRSMQDRLVRIANGEIKPRELDFENMERAGLAREEIDTLLKHIRENPEYAEVDGKKVQIFTGDGLDEVFLDKLGAAMNSMLARNMQKSFVGDTPIWMSKEVGKLATQFRAFSLIAIERQVAAGLRGDKIAMALKVMWGTALAGSAYYSRAYVKALESGDDYEDRWEMATDPANAAMGIANMSPQIGLLGFGMELGATAGLLDSGSGQSRSGARPITGVDTALPAAGVLTQGLTGTQSTVSGIMSGDSEEAMRGLKSLYGITPIVNTAGVGTAIALANLVND